MQSLIMLKFVFWWMLFSQSCAYDMLKLKAPNRNGHRTSSTLAWVPLTSSKKIPIHAVPVYEDDPSTFWCRAKKYSKLIPGQTDSEGKCEIAFISVKKANKFEILISINGSARLKRKAWDSYTIKPDNSLLSPDRVLAVVQRKNDSKLIAGNIGIENRDRDILVPEGNRPRKYDKGSIVVEDEPIKYELDNIIFDTKYHISEKPMVIIKRTLVNSGEEPSTMTDVVPFTIEEIQYWGKPLTTIAGMHTLVFQPELDAIEIEWGIETTTKREQFGNITYNLPPKSAVDVTLVGRIQKFQSLYTGSLMSIYSDNHSQYRSISSSHWNKQLTTVIAQYGVPFYLNGTNLENEETSELVYDSTSTTTSTTTTTTTITTSTTESTTIPSTTLPFIDIEMLNSSMKNTLDDSKLNISIRWRPESLTTSETESSPHSLTIDLPIDSPTNENTDGNNPEPSSASEMLLSGMAALITGLIFWYFGSGM